MIAAIGCTAHTRTISTAGNRRASFVVWLFFLFVCPDSALCVCHRLDGCCFMFNALLRMAIGPRTDGIGCACDRGSFLALRLIIMWMEKRSPAINCKQISWPVWFLVRSKTSVSVCVCVCLCTGRRGKADPTEVSNVFNHHRYGFVRAISYVQKWSLFVHETIVSRELVIFCFVSFTARPQLVAYGFTMRSDGERDSPNVLLFTFVRAEKELTRCRP